MLTVSMCLPFVLEADVRLSVCQLLSLFTSKLTHTVLRTEIAPTNWCLEKNAYIHVYAAAVTA